MLQRKSVITLKLIVSLITAVGCLLTAVIIPAKKVAAQTPFLSTPYYGRETQTQGFNPPTHEGIDWALYYESVLAAAGGNVAYAGWYDDSDRTRSYGLYVRINHTGDYSSYQTRYAHLSAIMVSEGEQGIQRGQIVGTSGNTGHVIPAAPPGTASALRGAAK